MINKILQISIPTYNRHFELDKCLNSLYVAYQSCNSVHKNQIAIRVYNNNDDDENNIINYHKQYYKNKFNNIKFIDNKKNIGSDLNIAQCYYYSEAKYTLVLGDDDYVVPNFFNEIMNIIHYAIKNNIGIVKYSAFGVDSNINFFVPISIFNSLKFYNSEDFLVLNNINLTFISGLIVPNCLNRNDIYKFVGTSLVQFGVVLLILKYKHTHIQINKYLVAATRSNSIETDKQGNKIIINGLKKENDFASIYIKNFYKIFDTFYNKRNKAFDKIYFERFVAYELIRRKLSENSNINIILNSYFINLNSYKIFNLINLKNYKKSILFIIVIKSRLFSLELIKILYYMASKVYNKLKNI